MEMDAKFLNKYMETMTNEINALKRSDVLQKTQIVLLEETIVDLKDKLTQALDQNVKSGQVKRPVKKKEKEKDSESMTAGSF